MKNCPYCGKEYPDDATICPIDGESLSVPVKIRKKVNGVWRGVYGYEETGQFSGRRPVPFTLKLEQGWLEHFTGTVSEDAPDGLPGTGIVDGYFQSPEIEFTKQMPVGYFIGPDGNRMTIREYVLAQGRKCEHDLPSPPIFYQGTFLDTNRVQGTWLIKPHGIPLQGGLSISSAQTSGYWCAEFMTTDTKASPTGGPTGPVFDKSLLPKPDSLQDMEPQSVPALRSLGKYSVADAEEILRRFEKEGLRFEINRDDSAMRQMMPFASVTGGYSGTAPMIEIFVNPDDESKAVEIMGEDDKVWENRPTTMITPGDNSPQPGNHGIL
jgi:hypothetical protein